MISILIRFLVLAHNLIIHLENDLTAVIALGGSQVRIFSCHSNDGDLSVLNTHWYRDI